MTVFYDSAANAHSLYFGPILPLAGHLRDPINDLLELLRVRAEIEHDRNRNQHRDPTTHGKLAIRRPPPIMRPIRVFRARMLASSTAISNCLRVQNRTMRGTAIRGGVQYSVQAIMPAIRRKDTDAITRVVLTRTFTQSISRRFGVVPAIFRG